MVELGKLDQEAVLVVINDVLWLIARLRKLAVCECFLAF